ncbi:MAG: CDP-alcohol phosphatidyltransferase family protein [Bacteroidetes bacterium]|nr:MAG: CDP-alcohol phosphatidyltransferase family protein [Bacteroidota bacterium]
MKLNNHNKAWYVINGITLYRIVAAPFLLLLLFTGRYDTFKWLLAVSFFTDLIDGFLARKYKVTSILGARLDSIGDDLTVLVGVIGLFVIEMSFIKEQMIFFIVLLALFIIQASYAFIRYKKLTTFHTYLAKTAALMQGVFLLCSFFFGPDLILFYTAVGITGLELLEEIILVGMIKKWEANVKGIYWVMRRKGT